MNYRAGAQCDVNSVLREWGHLSLEATDVTREIFLDDVCVGRKVKFLALTPTEMQNGEPGSSPFAHSAGRSDAEERQLRFAPQKRCVNGVKSLGPVESLQPLLALANYKEACTPAAI